MRKLPRQPGFSIRRLSSIWTPDLLSNRLHDWDAANFDKVEIPDSVIGGVSLPEVTGDAPLTQGTVGALSYVEAPIGNHSSLASGGFAIPAHCTIWFIGRCLTGGMGGDPGTLFVFDTFPTGDTRLSWDQGFGTKLVRVSSGFAGFQGFGTIEDDWHLWTLVCNGVSSFLEQDGVNVGVSAAAWGSAGCSFVRLLNSASPGGSAEEGGVSFARGGVVSGTMPADERSDLASWAATQLAA